jgi:hypothetical protein
VSAALRACRPSRTITLRLRDVGTLTQSPLPPGHEIHTNEIADLLKGTHDRFLRNQVSRAARKLSKARGSDFHTMLRNGKLVAWGCSRRSDGKAGGLVNENVPAGAAVLHDFDAPPGEEKALTTLLAHVMRESRSSGASQVWLLATNLDRAVVDAFAVRASSSAQTRQ